MRILSTLIFTRSSFCLCLLLLFFTSCQDTCKTTYSYQRYNPIYTLYSELREAVQTETPRALTHPGKIYFLYPYVFINELNKGVHIIDNSDPTAPQNIAFINIPGNVDIAIRDNILYADSYIDLVAIDIHDITNIQEVHRVEGIFAFDYTTDEEGVVTEWETEWVTDTYDADCQDEPYYYYEDVLASTDAAFVRSTALFSSGGNPQGIGGSMARFTLNDQFLYTVGESDLQLFDISTAATPQATLKIQLDWGVETIFPYEDKLFIGTTTGMHIMDNSNPASPQLLSTYAHVNSCDPVVVEGDIAYVTLRSGNTCAGFTDQLDVINLQDPKNPTLIKSYPMQNPHGLGIDESLLFICEGEFGLKTFDAKDPLEIDQNLLAFFEERHAYDVIPLGNILLMIGEDGLYQYNYTDPQNLELLSVIPVVAD